MGEYRLEDSAKNDLLEIGRYTARTWGWKQAETYLFAVERHFEAICAGTVQTRQPLPRRPELFASRCQHHYVFFAREDVGNVIILAILHENMDLIARLRERLDHGGMSS